jgi:hypothetical protein
MTIAAGRRDDAIGRPAASQIASVTGCSLIVDAIASAAPPANEAAREGTAIFDATVSATAPKRSGNQASTLPKSSATANGKKKGAAARVSSPASSEMAAGAEEARPIGERATRAATATSPTAAPRHHPVRTSQVDRPERGTRTWATIGGYE